MILLLLLLLKTNSLISPLGSCPAFEIRNSDIVTTSMQPGLNISVTANITLQSAQPDSSYQAVVSYRSLSLQPIEDALTLYLWISSKDSTSIVIKSKGQIITASVQILHLTYLIVPSAYNSYVNAFTFQGCFSAACLYDFTLFPEESVSLVRASPIIISNNSSVVGYLNTISLMITEIPLANRGISLDVFLINSSYCSIVFTSISTYPIYLKNFMVTIISYQASSSSYGLKFTPLLHTFPNALNDESLSPTATFFGIKSYSFINMAMHFSIFITNQTVTVNVDVNTVTLNVQIISFQVNPCCLSTPFLDSINGICTDTCAIKYYKDSPMMSCQACSYDCYECINSTTCTSCNVTTDFRQFNNITLRCEPIFGYYDPGVTTALPCSYPNCCGYTPAIYQQGASCLVTCPAGLIENHITRVCGICDPGYWPVSGHCTNVAGCTSTIINNVSVVCIFCGLADHFVLKNQTCVCSQGYNLDSTSGTCVQVCGDGIYFSHKCDDNNTVDGDGCSSTCEVEDYFRCSSISNYIPMDCAYVGKVQLIFNTASKTEGKNQGIFSFGISAQFAMLNLTKIISSFVFSCDPHVTVVTMSVSSTQILVFVDYQEDLQGRKANVTFILNPTSILTSSLSINFFMVSNREKLVVIKSYSTLAILKKTIQIIDLASLFVVVVGSLAYKMIGVELLHSFLLVYFTCLEGSSLTEPYLVFKNLRLLALNFKSQRNYYSQSNVFTYRLENKLFSKEFISLLLLSLLACILLGTIISTCLKDRIKILKCLRVFKHALQSLIFLISIGYGYLALMPTFISIQQSSVYQQVYKYQATSFSLLLVVIFSLIFFGQFKKSIETDKANNTPALLRRSDYTSIYLLFWLAIMSLFCVNSFYKSKWIEEYCFIFVMIFLVWSIFSRPYNSRIHNAGQIFNLLTDTIFIAWSIGRKYFVSLSVEEIQLYFSLATILLMLVSLALSIFRTTSVFYWNCKSTPVNNTAPAKKDGQIPIKYEKIQILLQAQNKYRIKSLLLTEELLNMNNSLNPADNPMWKKELMAEIKKKYKINKIDEEDSFEESNSPHRDK